MLVAFAEVNKEAWIDVMLHLPIMTDKWNNSEIHLKQLYAMITL